jgi:hypothetical protein
VLNGKARQRKTLDRLPAAISIRRAGDMTEEPRPASTVIAGVLIAYPEQPGMSFAELRIRVEGLMSLFTLLEDPAFVRRRRLRYVLSLEESGPPFPLNTLQFMTGFDIEVRRVRYNPVLEIIIGASVVSSAFLYVWERVSKARTAHYEANIRQAEAEMRQDDAEISRWRSEAAIQEQILREEIAAELRSRLIRLQDQQVVAEGEEDAADRMLNRAVREAIEIERVVPVDEKGRPILKD